MFIRMTSICLLALVIGGHGALAADWFALADYRSLKQSDVKTLELVLNAMQDTVYYAQESVGQPVICASPKLIESATLMAMIEDEINTPSNPMIRQYGDNDHMAFILMNALKNAKACR